LPQAGVVTHGVAHLSFCYIKARDMPRRAMGGRPGTVCVLYARERDPVAPALPHSSLDWHILVIQKEAL